MRGKKGKEIGEKHTDADKTTGDKSFNLFYVDNSKPLLFPHTIHHLTIQYRAPWMPPFFSVYMIKPPQPQQTQSISGWLPLVLPSLWLLCFFKQILLSSTSYLSVLQSPHSDNINYQWSSEINFTS